MKLGKKKQQLLVLRATFRKLQRTILQFARMKALSTQNFQQVRCAETKGTGGPIKKL